MNSNIKFRVWDTVDEKHTYSPNSHFLITLDGNIKDGRGCPYDESYILQQYSGVKDKNGKEIYEGDLTLYKPYREQAGTVEFHSGIFFVEWLDQTEDELGYMRTSDLEIVGNIYESPTT